MDDFKNKVMKLEKARIEYKKGNITFKQLEAIFVKHATVKQKDEFWNAPVYDRASIIEGKSKLERDKDWLEIINN